MERWVGKVAVVTGASAGIGLATSKALVKKGMIVVGLARRVDKMQKEMSSVSGPGKFYAVSCDVTKESDVTLAFNWIVENLKTIHILVNNAGISKALSFLDITNEDLQQVMNVNIMGVLLCSQQTYRIMKKNDHEGHIININSNAGHRVPNFGVPFNIYPATKHAITALSESYINEIKGEKIRVTSISPGIVKTEFFEAANVDLDLLKGKSALNPEDVAESIVHVISMPQHVQITELTIKPLGQCH